MAEAEAPKIWIVDDSRLECEVTASLLAAPARVETFGDGLALIDRVHADGPPDLVLCDWVMPGMSGLEVIEFLRRDARTEQIPIIVLTASGSNEDLSVALFAGADDFVRKPVDGGELRARIGRLLEKSARRNEHEREMAESWRVEQRRAVAAEQGFVAAQRQGSEMSERAHLAELFVGVLGHDLRTPLTAIMLGANLLGRPDVTPEARRVAAGRVATSVARMNEMIGRILDLTRSRLGGGIPVEPIDGDVGEVCHQVVDELRAARPNAILELTVHGDTVAPHDPGRLGQVLSNLVANALDYGRAGTPVRLRLDGSGALSVRLEVTNRGAPIPEALLGAIFLPFRRAAEKAGGATGSLGLGLFISKQIVEAHGGHIEVTSGAEETTFAVVLPRSARSSG